jgi:serine/threonine protein kinase/Tol biopolymer transport system component
MSVTIGSVLGSYEITALLGKGGFGEVYRAKDKKLKREVAIKILPDEFSTDRDRLTRFQREAEVLASLNHPNIAAIYDLAAQNKSQFLVLELVDGETLADRIARGPIPVDEALNIAKQICEALEAAHEKGIIHRDLKPANIKLTPDGKVKVLDFGLAKAYAAQATRAVDLSNSPTMLTNASLEGVIMGTAAYMSPEQAKGKDADRRSDIWAFGCLLFEMLSGSQPFEGETVGEILGGIFKSEPDWTRVPSATPAGVRQVLRRCLQKDSQRRLKDAGDIRIEIEDSSMESSVAQTGQFPFGNSKRERVVWIVTTVLLSIALASLAAVHFRARSTEALQEMRLDIATPEKTRPGQFALSPDGGSIVFVASGDGLQRLWLRRFDHAGAQAIAGTEDAVYPFWSPDGKTIGFFAGSNLKRVDTTGGVPVLLTDCYPGGGAWNTEGVILFVGAAGTGSLMRINASGGQPTVVTRIPGAGNVRFPEFLPDGHHFLLYATGTPDIQGIYLGSLDGGTPRRLGPADSPGRWLQPDRIIYREQGRLVARRFDLASGRYTNDPETIADALGLRSERGELTGAFSVSSNGHLAYGSPDSASYQLTWLDRTGKTVGNSLDVDANGEISPDGKRVAIDRTLQGNRDIWLIDIASNGMTRLTFDPALDGFPVWSADGSQIIFESRRKDNWDIYIKPSNGAGEERPLLELPGDQWPQQCSKDGKYLLYYDGSNAGDLWALPLSGSDRKPIAVATTAAGERTGNFSPDGKWIAYDTNQSGRFEVVVQGFPNPNGKWQVSTAGGYAPRWSADGKELYFVADGKLMAVSVHNDGTSFGWDRPTLLFQLRSRDIGSGGGGPRAFYSISVDGRFLMDQLQESSVTTPITLILNWHPKDSR